MCNQSAKSDKLFLVEFTIKPKLCRLPDAHHGTDGNAQRFGDLIIFKTAEKTHLDNLRLSRVNFRESFQTFTVTNANNAGAGRLRDAVTQANANAQADTINFDPAVFGSAQTITLTSEIIITPDGASPGRLLLSTDRARICCPSAAATQPDCFFRKMDQASR